ncbi:MAG: CocE/NonD family hydrolase, partial [Candidatus Tectomicrobia bacterium]|nr:CocE/NonD family hydrolase [Candidatus Tectomicrobia bacterium]
MPDHVALTIERNVPARMRDGTTLYADVYRPSDSGKYPVILQRTPYCKDLVSQAAASLDPLKAASRGYVLIIQDTRGRYTSEGEFYTFRYEAEDGYDTIEWAGS